MMNKKEEIKYIQLEISLKNLFMVSKTTNELTFYYNNKRVITVIFANDQDAIDGYQSTFRFIGLEDNSIRIDNATSFDIEWEL